MPDGPLVSWSAALWRWPVIFWLQRLIQQALTQGENFVPRKDDITPKDSDSLPNPLYCFTPLIGGIVLILFGAPAFGYLSALIVALAGGIALTYLLKLPLL